MALTKKRLKVVGDTTEVSPKDIHDQNDWIETSEAAQILRGSYSVIRKYINQGKIHFVKDSPNRMRVYRPDIMEISKDFVAGNRKRNKPTLTKEGYDCSVIVPEEIFRGIGAFAAVRDKETEQLLQEYIIKGFKEDLKKGFRIPGLSPKKEKTA